MNGDWKDSRRPSPTSGDSEASGEARARQLAEIGRAYPLVQQALDEAESRVQSAEDGMLRALAESENQKKRLVHEQSDRIRFANEKLLLEMLSVLDSLELCLSHAGPGAKLRDVVDGLELTLSQFHQTLRNAGVEAIETELVAPFDPKVHEAVLQDDEVDLPERTIARVVQAGFMYRERVLRAAKVVVSTGRGQTKARAES